MATSTTKLTLFHSILLAKAHERKQRWLAKMLLEHNSACVIQHNYRTHRFLMRFLKKAHARKMQWMREAEVSERSERALKKDAHTSLEERRAYEP